MILCSLRHGYSLIIMLTLFSTLMPVSAYACGDAKEPHVLLKGLSSYMISSVNDSRESIQQDSTVAVKLIEDILLPHADFELASRKVLIFHWQKLNDQQRQQFVDSFRVFLIRFSSVILANYMARHDKELKANVLEFENNYISTGKIAKVRSTVLNNSGKRHTVGYLLHCKQSAWKIYDVSIDGVWIIKQYQAQFKKKIEREGFDRLIAFLDHTNDVMLADMTN